MSSPERTGAKEDKPLSPAKQGKVRQKLHLGATWMPPKIITSRPI